MGSFSLVHWAIVLLVIILLFGGGRVSGLMGDVARGIKSFKKGLADNELEGSEPEQPKHVGHARTEEQPIRMRDEKTAES